MNLKTACSSMIFGAAVLCLPLQANAFGNPFAGPSSTFVETDTLPNGDFTSNVKMGDVWSFSVRRAGVFDISVDTREDIFRNFGPSWIRGSKSGLDPAFVLVDDNGNIMGEGDEEMACTVTPECGFSCPSLEQVELPRGSYKLVVFDYGQGDSCTGGGYTLKMGGTGVLQGVRLQKDDKNIMDEAGISTSSPLSTILRSHAASPKSR